MRLVSLRLQNCRQHADTTIVFPGTGITGILGANEAGKSTVLECVLWALFGAKDALRSSAEDFRWKRSPAKRKAVAELTFEIGGSTYIVNRTEDTAHLYLSTGGAPIAAGTTPVNDYLRTQVLRMSFDEFTRSHVCLQKELTALATLKPAPRQEFVREVLGLNVLDRALEGCRKRMNEMKRERDGQRVGLGEREPLETELESARQAHSAAADQVAGLVTDRSLASAAADSARAAAGAFAADAERYAELQADVRDATRREAEAQEKLTTLMTQLEDADEAHAELMLAERDLASLTSRRDEIQRVKDRASERAGVVSSIASAEMDLNTAKATLAQLDATIAAFDPEALKNARALHDAHTKALTAVRARIASERGQAVALARSTEQDINKAARKIAAIKDAGAEGVCPTCLRTLSDTLGLVLDRLEAELADANRRHIEAVKVADTYCGDEKSDDELLAEEDVSAAEDTVRALRVQQTKAETAAADRPRIAAQIERISTQLGEYRERLDKLPSAGTVDELELKSIVADIERVAGIPNNPRVPGRIAGLRNKAGGRDTLRRQIEEWEKASLGAVDKLHQANNAIVALAFDSIAHEQAVRAADVAAKELSTLTTRLATAEAELKAAVDWQGRASKALATHDTRAAGLKDLEQQIQTHERAATRLDDFRAAQAAAVRPEMEELISGLINVLTDGRHPTVTVNEDFSLTLQKDGVDEAVVSGGTEDLAALAQRIAISVMSEQRAGHPVSLLWLDEPFLSSDETRRGNVLNLIRELGDRFSQVILISHVEETRTCADHIIELAYDEDAGCTRVAANMPKADEAELVAA